MASEETVVRILDLPVGQDWAWFADLNIVGLSRRLDCEGRKRAIIELQSAWSARHLRVIEAA